MSLTAQRSRQPRNARAFYSSVKQHSETTKSPMLNFIFFFGVLALAGFSFGALWRAMITPVNRYFVSHDTPTGIVQVAWFLLQIYIVFGWTALCVGMTHLFIAKPGVVHWWGYYILAFLGSVAPLYDRTRGSTNTIALFSFVSFLAFSFFPSLTGPWNWFLKFI